MSHCRLLTPGSGGAQVWRPLALLREVEPQGEGPPLVPGLWLPPVGRASHGTVTLPPSRKPILRGAGAGREGDSLGSSHSRVLTSANPPTHGGVPRVSL